VKVSFSTEVGGFKDGEFVWETKETEAKICEKGDYILSENEEAALGLIGKAYCKPDSFKYKISGQFSSSSMKTTAIRIVPCSFFNEAEAACEKDIDKIKEALRTVSLNLTYK